MCLAIEEATSGSDIDARVNFFRLLRSHGVLHGVWADMRDVPHGDEQYVRFMFLELLALEMEDSL